MQPEEQKKVGQSSTYLQWTFTLLVNISLLVHGIEHGWISPIAKNLQSDSSPIGYPVPDNIIYWIISSMSLAAILSVPVYAYIADSYGRRVGVILIALPQAISWLIRVSYSSSTTLIIARIITGIASGGCFNIVPIYVKEISQDNIRGTLGSVSTLSQTIGIFLVYIIGAYLDYHTMNCIILSFPIITILVMLKAPESPAFLVKQGKMDEAMKAVALLRGLNKNEYAVQSVVNAIKSEEDYFRTLPTITFLSILRQRSWRKAVIISLFMFTFFELNGAVVVVTYASTILRSTGVDFEVRPEIQALSFPIVMIMGSLMVTTCVEKIGRKPLLVMAYIVTACSMFSIAAMMLLQKYGGSVPAWLPVIVMILSVFMYSGGVLPLSFIIITEMFNFQVRAKIMGFVVTYACFLIFMLITIYTLLSSSLGTYSAFLFFGFVNLVGSIFSIIWIPETKGKSEEEILKTIVNDKKITANVKEITNDVRVSQPNRNNESDYKF